MRRGCSILVHDETHAEVYLWLRLVQGAEFTVLDCFCDGGRGEEEEEAETKKKEELSRSKAHSCEEHISVLKAVEFSTERVLGGGSCELLKSVAVVSVAVSKERLP